MKTIGLETPSGERHLRTKYLFGKYWLCLLVLAVIAPSCGTGIFVFQPDNNQEGRLGGSEPTASASNDQGREGNKDSQVTRGVSESHAANPGMQSGKMVPTEWQEEAFRLEEPQVIETWGQEINSELLENHFSESLLVERFAKFQFPTRMDRIFYDKFRNRLLVWKKGKGFYCVDLDRMELLPDVVLHEEGFPVAVGAHRLISGSPDSQLIRIYDLETFAQVGSFAPDLSGKIFGMALDPISDQRVLIANGNTKFEFFLYDLNSGKKTSMYRVPHKGHLVLQTEGKIIINSNPSFTLFSYAGDYLGSEVLSLDLRRSKIERIADYYSAAYVDAVNRVYGDSESFQVPTGIYPEHFAKYSIPHDAGGYYLQVETIPKDEILESSKAVELDFELVDARTRYKISKGKISIGLPFGTEFLDYCLGQSSDRFFDYIHKVYLSKTHTLAFLHLDMVYLYKMPLPGSGKGLPESLLLVTSTLPPQTPVGKTSTYKIEILSGSPKVDYQVMVGPQGIHVSRRGEVSWTRPFEDHAPHQVIIKISNKAGTEVFHAFKI